MARKNRPEAAREALARQQARTRRGAPGKRFVGERAPQRRAARARELRAVARMAEVDAAVHRAEEIGTPVAAIVAELVEDAVRLLRSLVAAPFRIARALRQPRIA